jgi:hypothetical protein
VHGVDTLPVGATTGHYTTYMPAIKRAFFRLYCVKPLYGKSMSTSSSPKSIAASRTLQVARRASVNPSALYPNKPSWATTEVLAVDGTIVAAEDGSAFGVPEFGSWYGGTGPAIDRVTLVADSDNPLGNNSAINFQYIESIAGIASSNNLGSSVNGYDKLYFMFRVKLIGTGWNESGCKFFYFGDHNGNATRLYFDRPTGEKTSLRLLNQSGASTDGVPDTEVAMDTGPGALSIDTVLNCEVAVDRLLGTTEAWINGVSFGQNLNVQGPSFPMNKVQWYATTNAGSFTTTVNMRLYELYIAGQNTP